MKQRLRTVRWRDAHSLKDETSHDDAMRSHKPAIYYTSGILVHSDDKGVTVSQDYGLPLNEGDEFTYRTRTFIPREMIDEEYDCGPLIRTRRKKKPVADTCNEQP